MRILITNDDGYDADGHAVLRRIASQLSDDVWSVAPEQNKSGAGHSLTLQEPLRLRQIDDRSYAVNGTPTDCTIMGVSHILKGNEPDLILSGVNRGMNGADDVVYSGTIAAAREGVMLGIPAVALSQVFGPDTRDGPHYSCSENLAPNIIRKLLKQREEFPESWTNDTLYNLNFPNCRPEDVQGQLVVQQGRRDQRTTFMDERFDTWGRSYYWFDFGRKQPEPPEGTDLWAIAHNYVAITPLHLNMTNTEVQTIISKVF